MVFCSWKISKENKEIAADANSKKNLQGTGSSTWVGTADSALDSCPGWAVTHGLFTVTRKQETVPATHMNASDAKSVPTQHLLFVLEQLSPSLSKLSPGLKPWQTAQVHRCWTGVTPKQGKLVHAYLHMIRTRSFLRASRALVYWATSCGAGVSSALQGCSQLAPRRTRAWQE